MKKVYILALLMAASLGLSISSCKSTPKQPPVEEPRGKLSSDELGSAAARAEAARKLAVDFECPAYFPSDWESVEGRYMEAQGLPRDTEEKMQNAIGVYNEITGIYEGLFDRTIPLYAQAREDEIIAARDEIKSTSLISSYPDYLSGADQTALEALAKYEGKDYYAARDTSTKALTMYQILKTGGNAYLSRKEILSHEFVSYDTENFDKAEEAGKAAIDAYDKGDLKAAGGNADEALLRYNLVRNAGWAVCISELETSANAERQKALAHKANVAARDVFNAGNALFDQAAGLQDAAQYADAAAMYTEAEAQFAEATRIAEEKRLLAEEAIREAEEKIEASDEAARQAEIVIGGESE
jgi:hypothetical protein